MKGKLRKLLCLVFAIALLGSLMAGCGGDSKETPAPSASADAPKDSTTADDGEEDDKDASSAAGGLENGITPREETLYMGGLMWGPPANFNPMSSTGVFPTNSGDGSKILVYEPLFMYNLMATDNGTNGLEPLLGTEFSWEGNDLIVKLNPAAKFSDGEAFTAEDAAFSFQLGSDYSIPWSSAADIFTKVEAKDDHTLVLTMIEGGNKLMAIRQLGRVPMMPKHIWEPLTKEMEEAEIRAYENFDPIGTGPYTVLYYDDTRIVCLRNDEYWGQDASMFGKLPAPKYITVLRWNDNAGINTAFANGELDITESFLPQVWQLWEDGAPVKTYLNDSPYHVPAVLVTLVFNLEKPGLNNPDVRRAIAYAINYPRISELAMSGYSQDIVPSLMLPQEMEQWLNEDDEMKSLRWTYDKEKAVEILDGLGAEPGADGVRVLPDGTRLGFWKLECPKGFSDWTAALEIVAQNLKEVGFDVGSELPESAQVTNHKQMGEFDMIMDRPAFYVDPSQPWARCQYIMDISGVPAIGEQAFTNPNRYSNDRATEIIKELSVTEDNAKMKELYTELDKIYLKDIPQITLMYRPYRFYTVYEGTWTNWPTEDNDPDIPPFTGFDGAAVRALYTIELKK